MKTAMLPNGLKVIYDHKKSNSVVIQVMVKVGSDSEKDNERGISHFLEHILFEGTKKRPTNKEITNEIEKIGGDFNAYTSNEKTCFYIKVLKKHFAIALEVLSDIIQNPLLQQGVIDKEKNVILKEIDMVHDEPRFYQWILLQENLFEKHPCRNPTYGNKNIIKALTKNKAAEFYRKYYVPNNMAISVVGNVKDWKNKIAHKFTFKRGNEVKAVEAAEPKARKKEVIKKKKIINTHIVFGFKTVPRKHNDSYVFDVINGILGRGQSGRMFNEIRSKRGLAYEVGTQSIAERSFGYFAVYAIIDKKNVNAVKKIIFEQLNALKNITKKDLKEAQDFIEGDYLLEVEDTQKVADKLLFWDLVADAKQTNRYLPKIKRVTVEDVRKAAKEYLKNYTLVVLKGK